MVPALLLFDIDGTLLRTNGAGMRAMKRVAGEMFGSDFAWDGIDPAGHLDPLIYAEAAALNAIPDPEGRHADFHDRYVAELRRELDASRHDVQVMPGIHAVLSLLRQRQQRRGDLVLGLLTGNYAKAVPIKLAAIHVAVEWFTITAYGDEGRTRPDLVTVALGKYQRRFGHPADPRRVLVIGDTPRDVHCAHAHGCMALAVATGGHSPQRLAAAGADLVLPDLSDPAPLLHWLDHPV